MHWDELLELGECWVVSEETVRILEIMTLYTVPLSKILTLKLIKIIVLLFIKFAQCIVLMGWGAPSPFDKS